MIGQERRRPTREDLLRADQARAEAVVARLPRRGNDPYQPEPLPRSGITYRDPVGAQAAASVDRERRGVRR